MKPKRTTPEATTSPADSTPSAMTEVEPANQPTTIFPMESSALTKMLTEAIRLPICRFDVVNVRTSPALLSLAAAHLHPSTVVKYRAAKNTNASLDAEQTQRVEDNEQ